MDTELGEIVSEAANSVYEELGGGLSECIYRNALAIALRKLGCTVEAEVIVPIFYQAQYVGSLRPDIVVNKQVVLELKAVAKVTESHISQTRGEALLKLLDEKAKRNGQLRAAADERESQLSEQITLLEAELCEAHAATQAATEQVEALKRQVEEAKRAGEADEAAMASALATFTRQEAVRVPGKRGPARKGAQRAGLPTFKTASLNYESVPLFKRRGWSKVADIKRAIVALKTDKGGNITGDLHAVSTYQARDAVTLFNMDGAPWQRGCLVSFLDYMQSQRFEATGAKDRKHWVCMKLWPGRFGTKEEYLQHRACMSKAGKFITSVGKLRALYECDLSEQLELQK